MTREWGVVHTWWRQTFLDGCGLVRHPKREICNESSDAPAAPLPDTVICSVAAVARDHLLRERHLGTDLALTTGVSAADDGVLIIGGAGKTGALVAKLLVARHVPVTVFVRTTTDRSRLAGLPVRYVEGDGMRQDDVAAAFAGRHYSVIFETVQVRPGAAEGYTQLYENFVPWAKRTGVRQFITLGGGCGDRAAKDCPLSPPLYRLTEDMTRAEHVLRDSGVPYTIIRVGALIPGNPNDPAASMATGHSSLTTDVHQFGVVLRGDLAQQVVGCIGAKRCVNSILVIDDPTLKPQLDHWLCKRRYETDTVHFSDPRCGDMPAFTPGSLHALEP